jgi:hypothetical protein
MHPPFRRRRRPCPIRDRFVRDGSTPPALAAVVSGDRRFGQALDDDDDGLPSQSVSNIERVMTSSSCSLSLLVSVSVVFIDVLLFPKHPSQSRRRITSKKSRAYPPAFASVSSSSFVATPLPSLPSRSSHPMNNMLTSITGINIVAITVLPTAVAAAPVVIASRPPSARRRRESSRRRQGSAPLHPSHSSSSVAADAAADAVP